MIKSLVFLVSLSVFISAINAQLTYPVTKKVDQSDTYFGVKVEDPYRWFENDSSQEVKNWVTEENKVTNSYLSTIPFREQIRQRIKELNDVPYYTSPYHVGEYYFYEYNTGLQPQEVIYRQKGLTGKGEVFIDPNNLSTEGTTRVGLFGYSEDKKFVTTITRKAGSDWTDLNVVEVTTGKKMPDELKWVKNTGIAWKGNGFFYSRYPPQSPGNELSMRNEN
jgi:prolyl oligopeptidase